MHAVDRSAGCSGSVTEGLDGALGVVGVMGPTRYRRLLPASADPVSGPISGRASRAPPECPGLTNTLVRAISAVLTPGVPKGSGRHSGARCACAPMRKRLQFVPTQAIGRVHATAAEAVARAPEALLMWTAPDRFVPLRRPRARGPGLRAARQPPHCPMPVDRRHPTQRRKCLTPEPRVATSAPRSDLQSVQGRPPFPAPAPRDECTRRRAARIPKPTWSPTGIP